ncbi:MAG: metal-dependent hydrolase [Deltaproteobacteria bacterium]|nr:metal-dependent hydrolase [Deltaproteobacteria bacterium]
MALPIAHAAAGYLVHRAARRVPSRDRSSAGAWRRAVSFMVIGNLPDCDFLIGFVVGRPGLVHRGVSHTILAAVIFGALAGIVARSLRGKRFLPTALAFAVAYGSHLLLDWLTIDSRPPEGAQFLWPFSDAYYIAPVAIFREIHIDGLTRAGFLGSLLGWPTVLVLAREAALVVGAVAVWCAVEIACARVAAPALRLKASPEDGA